MGFKKDTARHFASPFAPIEVVARIRKPQSLNCSCIPATTKFSVMQKLNRKDAILGGRVYFASDDVACRRGVCLRNKPQAIEFLPSTRTCCVGENTSSVRGHYCGCSSIAGQNKLIWSVSSFPPNARLSTNEDPIAGSSDQACLRQPEFPEPRPRYLLGVNVQVHFFRFCRNRLSVKTYKKEIVAVGNDKQFAVIDWMQGLRVRDIFKRLNFGVIIHGRMTWSLYRDPGALVQKKSIVSNLGNRSFTEFVNFTHGVEGHERFTPAMPYLVCTIHLKSKGVLPDGDNCNSSAIIFAVQPNERLNFSVNNITKILLLVLRLKSYLKIRGSGVCKQYCVVTVNNEYSRSPFRRQFPDVIYFQRWTPSGFYPHFRDRKRDLAVVPVAVDAVFVDFTRFRERREQAICCPRHLRTSIKVWEIDVSRAARRSNKKETFFATEEERPSFLGGERQDVDDFVARSTSSYKETKIVR